MMKMGGGKIGRKGGIGLVSKQVDAGELLKKSDSMKERQTRAAEQAKIDEAAAAQESASSGDSPPEGESTDVTESTDSTESTESISEPTAEAEPTAEVSADVPIVEQSEASVDGAGGSFDLEGLMAQLSQLRTELRSRATEPEHDESVAAVGRAERALKKAQDELKTAGQWALDTAQELNLSGLSGILSSLV